MPREREAINTIINKPDNGKMKKSLFSSAVATAIALAGTTAAAAPFNSFDPRSMGMGGAGVAVGNTATAPFFNPALLAAVPEDDNFAVELPIVGGRFYDPDEFVDSVDNFQDNPTIFNANGSFVLEQSINAATPTDSGSYRIVASDIQNLSLGLQSVSDKNIQAEAGVATVIGIPGRDFGGAFSISGWGAFGGIVHYRDGDTLAKVAEDLNTYAQCLDTPATCDLNSINWVVTDPADPRGNVGDVLFDPNRDLASSVDIRGIVLSEIAFAMGHEIDMGGSALAVGITPKFVTAKTYDYHADVNTADEGDFNAEEHAKEHHNLNLDVGLARTYGNWRTGLVVKNVLAQEYDTVRGNKVKLNPQARFGVSYQSGWTTFALDADLTENEPVDFEGKSRYVSLGTELNLLDWAQLRLGYRADTVNDNRNVASVGLGLSPLGVHLDLAVAGNSDEIGASAQFGFRF